jgi:hypothetical protein
VEEVGYHHTNGRGKFLTVLIYSQSEDIYTRN